MTNLANHTACNIVVFEFYNAIHLSQTHGVEGSLLILRSTYSALCLLNFDSCHSALSSEYFFNCNTTLHGDSTCVANLRESLDGGLDEVVGVGRTL